MTVYEFQEMYPTMESKEDAARELSDEQLDEFIKSAGHVQAKILYSRFKKKNQLCRYSQKYNELAVKAMEYYLCSKDKNIVLSPFSIIVLLSIAADAVSGLTKQEILDVLGSDLTFERILTETVTISDGRHEYTRIGKAISSNAVCVLDKLEKTINPEYENKLGIYHGKLFSSNDIINDDNTWNCNNTNGMIPRAIETPSFGVLACLINAIAFESQWEKTYEDYDICDGKFTNADNSVSKVKMLQGCESQYIENKNLRGFIKHYKDYEYSFMALLPQKEGFKNLQSALKHIDFTELFTAGRFERVLTSMPEFKYDFGEDLKELFMKMGINSLFSDSADFSPMSSAWLKMESILHKAHIEVDRNGTKAAAATVGLISVGSAPVERKPKEVCLDRPFIYAVMHNETKLPVFTGIVNKL